ncbi:MAG TPA: Fur family transcriptional regulator [Clostridia bacterium]
MVDIKQQLLEIGLKPTAARRLILSIFYQSAMPVSAEDIYKQFLENGQNVNLSTIYRTLEALKDGGLIRSLTFEGSDKALFELKQRHTHYLMCLGCKKIQPVDFCPLKDIQNISGQNFTVTEHRFDLYGYCQDCKNK